MSILHLIDSALCQVFERAKMEKAFLRRGQAFPEPSATEKVQTIYKWLLTVTKDRNIYVHIKRPFIECLSIFPVLPRWRLYHVTPCSSHFFLFLCMKKTHPICMRIYLFIYIYIQQTLATMFIYMELHGFTFSIQRLVVSLAWFVTGKPFGLKFHPSSQVSTPVCLPQAGPCISWHKWI